MTTITPDTLPRHVPAQDAFTQTMVMAWRATKKMRRNFEQFFDVTIQPLLFTAMFAGIFGGAISGSVENYLPILIPGLIAQTMLTACVATGTQLREDMDKGVFDRFKVLPISRVAPLAGPMVADMIRYAIAATLTFATGIAMGYRPGGGVLGVSARSCWRHRRLVAGLDLHVVRDRRLQRAGGAGLLADGDVPADVPVQRLRARRHAAGLARDVHQDQPGVARRQRAARPGQPRRVTAEVGWALVGCLAVIAVFAPLSVRSFTRKMCTAAEELAHLRDQVGPGRPAYSSRSASSRPGPHAFGELRQGRPRHRREAAVVGPALGRRQQATPSSRSSRGAEPQRPGADGGQQDAVEREVESRAALPPAACY